MVVMERRPPVPARTLGDIQRDALETQRQHAQTEERLNNMRPQSPDGSGFGVLVGKTMSIAMRTGGRRLYQAPSGGYFYSNSDEMVPQVFVDAALERIERWKLEAAVAGKTFIQE